MMDQKYKSIEELIQRSLTDELPKDVEARFTRQIHEFFDTRQEEQSNSIPDFSWLQPFLDWISKPAVSYTVTAALFAFMILVSAFMHISKEKNALATAIDTIQLTAKVFSAIETAYSLIVKEQRIETGNDAVSNTIHWANGISRIDFENGETWLIGNGQTEIRHPGQDHTIIEPLHETAALFATPEQIKNQLMGKWNVSKREIHGSTAPIQITVENMREGYQIQLWVDPSTHLPVRIETHAVELPGGGTINWDNIQMDLAWNQNVNRNGMNSNNQIEGEKE